MDNSFTSTGGISSQDIRCDYIFAIFFSSKWGKETITVNLINYGRMMPECINSLEDYDGAKLLLRRNMENPLERQKAYIKESIFVSGVHC